MRVRTAPTGRNGTMQWRMRQPDAAAVAHVQRGLQLPEQFARVLVNRGFFDPDEVQRFLDAPLSSLHDPMLLAGLRTAAERILHAIGHNERIVIYGDYDVDGVTATALLMRVLRSLGGRVSYYVPHRATQGYGLHADAIREIAQKHAQLIITVDCGINAVEPVALAQRLGIDVIITDHHEPTQEEIEDDFELAQQASLFEYALESGHADTSLTRCNFVLPGAHAVINPKCGHYPFSDLAGVGVAFKLAHGVVKLARERNLPNAFAIDLKEHLDLVALGTIADAVPLRDENRVLVRHGLKALATTRKIGLKKLIEISRLQRVDAETVVFGLAPRLNAAGRMGDAREAVELLLTASTAEAEQLARNLDGINSERQRVEKLTFDMAVEIFESSLSGPLPACKIIPGGLKAHLPDGPSAIVLAHEEWNPGVIGIVASRMVERYYLPTVIIALEGERGRGSCRSIRGFHLLDALRQCGGLLEKYGGHRVAAGITVARDKIDTFRAQLNASVSNAATMEDLAPALDIDAEFHLRDYTIELADTLAKFPPYGQNNPAPVFVARGVKLVESPVSIKDRHIKFCVMQDTAYRQVIAFNWFGNKDAIAMWARMDIVFHPYLDTYREPSLQLQLIDAQESP